MANSMMTIEIYRHAGTWCFTDEARGLLHEPFVLGIPDIIDNIIKDNEKEKHTITFSSQRFPLCYMNMKKVYEEYGGAWYELESALDMTSKKKGWLCPATLKFFSDFPDNIYFDIA